MSDLISILQVREEVYEFAMAMERRLREKDEERGGNSWKEEGAQHLRIILKAHMTELESRILSEEDPKKKAVDVANLAMMIWDISK